MAQKKLKFAFVSLTSCEGCYVELIDMHKKFIELKDKIEIVEFRLFEDDHHSDTQKIDVAFVEGSPITQENIDNLKKIRKNAKYVVSCGSCAHIGGIYHMKNYYDRDKLMEHIYQGENGLDNPKILPISGYVKIDYHLPACPIIGEEMLEFIYAIVNGKMPVIHQNPVCYECTRNGYECLLKKGEICFGPITQGGCNAICVKSKQACWGCRGLLKKPQVKNWKQSLKDKGHNDSRINEVMKVFGIKDLI